MPVPFRKTPLAIAIGSVLIGGSPAYAFTPSAAGAPFEIKPDPPAPFVNEAFPHVAADDNGNFVVVWEESGDLLYRRFAADGTPQGSEQVVPAINASNFQQNQQVSMDDDGDFVIAWNAYYGVPYYAQRVVFQRFDNSGSQAGSPTFADNSVLSVNFQSPDVALDADGDFVVAWQGYYSTAEPDGISYRLFDNVGGALGPTQLANTTTAGAQVEASVARAGAGDFVIAWTDLNSLDGDVEGVFAQRFGAGGGALGSEFQVNQTTNNSQRTPSVDVDDDGDFAIAWRGSDFNGAGLIDYRLFAADGTEIVPETNVDGISSNPSYPADFPAVALRRSNDVVVVWQTFDGDQNGVFGHAFAPDGSSDGSFPVSEPNTENQRFATIAMDQDGDFVVAYQRFYSGPDEEDAYARRFLAPLPPGVIAIIKGTGGGPGSLGWLGALGLGLMAAGRKLCRRRRRRGGGLAGLLAGALALGSLGGAPPVEAAEPVEAGYVDQASGAVSAIRPGESARSLSRGDPVFTGDRVRTGADARAILRLVDGTRVSLRASSDFRVAEIRQTRDEDGGSSFTGMFMDLLRGGLRMITGRIAERDRDNYELRTPVATIGVRGTEFDARLCPRGECPEAEGDLEPGPEPVARVIRLNGVVVAEGINAATRVLDTGTGIYLDDAVTTAADAWAVLRFTDGSKVSLQPDTEFRVDEWEFDREEPGAGSALLNLLRGGIRVLTGLIGRESRDDYRVATPVATIGIRGTGFDLQCLGDCIDAAAQAVRSVQGDGLLVNTWDGEIFAQLEGRIAEFAAGQSGFLANASAAPLRLPEVPQLFRQLPAPRPDTVSGPLQLEGAERLDASVQDGTIVVQGAQGPPVVIGAGGAAVIGAGGGAQPLEAVPGSVGAGLGVPAATIAGAFGQLMLAQFDLGAWYAGGTAGTGISGSESEFEDRLQSDFPSASVESLDNEAIATRVFGGFRLLGLLGVEVGYMDLGDLESKIDPGSASPSAVADDALDKHPFTPSGVDVSTLVFAPGDLFGNTRAFARAGLFAWEGEIETVTPSGQKFSKDVSGTDPLVGGGVEVRVGPNLHARAEWIRYELDPDPVDYVGAGLVWTIP